MSENTDELNYLRIPFDNINFGEKLEDEGYGSVFKGEFGDRRVALKQLNITNLGNIKQKLLGEILTISRFRHHPNLVALLGFCDERSNEIILVYEYLASGNLADKMRNRLNTIQRFEICLGAARGLDYLHSGVDSTKIVHGHVKLSKILLNSDLNSSKFEVKVSGFGLSKIIPGLAEKSPEFEVKEKATVESDVYSFGVLLLEVLCGVPELVDTDDYLERHVSELVPKRLEQDKLRKIVHFDIIKEIKTEALDTYAKIACQCVMENPNARPSMTQVVEELEKALRLQGGEVGYVQIVGSEKIDGGDDETVDSTTLEEEPQEEEIVAIEEDAKEVISDVAGEDYRDEISKVDTSSESTKNSEDDMTEQAHSFTDHSESVPDNDITHVEDAEKEIDQHTHDPEIIVEIICDLKLDEESKIIVANELNSESKIPLTSMETTMNSRILDLEKEDAKSTIKSHDTKKEPEPINNTREIYSNDFDTTNLTSTEKTAEDENKRCDSTSSGSSNGNDTTLSDPLLQKSSPNGNITKKTSYESRSCCYCSWHIISNSLNMLQSYFVTNTMLE